MKDTYYDRSEVSNSDLSKLKQDLYGTFERDPTESFKFGNLIDHMITEPQKVNYFNYTCGDDALTEDDFLRAEEMKKSFFRDKMAKGIFSLSEPQKIMINHGQLFDYDIKFFLPVRCKWDLWMPSLGWGGDIKSTSATTQKQFEDAVTFFDYDRQRFFYMNISGSTQDVLIGISKENFKVFTVKIKQGDKLWKSGQDKCFDLAFKYWEMFGDLKQTA